MRRNNELGAENKNQRGGNLSRGKKIAIAAVTGTAAVATALAVGIGISRQGGDKNQPPTEEPVATAPVTPGVIDNSSSSASSETSPSASSEFPSSSSLPEASPASQPAVVATVDGCLEALNNYNFQKQDLGLNYDTAEYSEVSEAALTKINEITGGACAGDIVNTATTSFAYVDGGTYVSYVVGRNGSGAVVPVCKDKATGNINLGYSGENTIGCA